jgi:hypothetical protein
MKFKLVLTGLLIVLAVIASGCGIAQSLMGTQGGTVSTLWSDVPPLPNATKTDIGLPPVTNILIQGFIQAANAQNTDSGTRLDKFDFIAFNTPDTPEQVSQFYSQERMTGAGWNAQDTPGCQGGIAEGGAGAFCAFGKEDGGTSTILMIIPVKDGTNPTQVFYVRFQGTQTQ